MNLHAGLEYMSSMYPFVENARTTRIFGVHAVGVRMWICTCAQAMEDYLNRSQSLEEELREASGFLRDGAVFKARA